MLNRRTVLTATASLVAAPFLLTRTAMAAEPEVFAQGGIAIRGADPVAFFAGNGPVTGSADHALMWRGVTWHFASDENVERFMMNPESYAPQYGGYCAYAMAQGALASTVPEAWTLHDGKLYLNYSTGVRGRWLADKEAHIASADANWPTVLG